MKFNGGINKIGRFQTGGEMPAGPEQAQTAPEEQTAPEQGGDPMEQIMQVIMQLAQAADQALQSNDPQQLAQVCQGLVQLAGQLQQAMGGGAEQGGAPVFKRGGKVVKKKPTMPWMKGKEQVSEKKCGGKMTKK